MEFKINITDLVEKYGNQELSVYMKRGSSSYKSLCELIDYAFSEDIDAFVYYSKILIARFNSDDKSGGFIESDKTKMYEAIKVDPSLASEIIACNRDQRKMLSKYPYGYTFIELLRLTLYAQFEKQKETCRLILPEFIYYDENSSSFSGYQNMKYIIKDKSLEIVRE